MQRIILKQLKADVLRLQGPISGELAQYFESYKKEFSKLQSIATKKELIEDIKDADIVFGADFHAFLQSQKTHLRILRELAQKRQKIILALEAIEIKHQSHVENYLKGRISEKTLLKNIDYEKSWGFPWEHYKIFFEFAREKGCLIYGLNTQELRQNIENELAQRDLVSAQKVAQLFKDHKDALIYVLYGDLHMSRNKLPFLTRQALKNKKAKMVTVFQNSEKLYWKLAALKKEEKVDVLKLRTRTYCVFNSPPWLKWQAYLDFLEKKAGGEEQPDISDVIHKFCNVISEVLSIKEKYFDFHVFKKGDLQLAHTLSKFKLSRAEQNYLEKLLLMNRSFFIPRLNIFYLTSTTPNKIVALVGQYIYCKKSASRKIATQMPHDFDVLVWWEAIGFFMSKILNNRRKISLPETSKSHKRVAVLAMEYRLKEQLALSMGEKIKPLAYNPKLKIQHYHEAAALVGAVLGQKMYDALMQGFLKKDRLRSWLEQAPDRKTDFKKFYLNVLLFFSELKLKSVNPQERL